MLRHTSRMCAVAVLLACTACGSSGSGGDFVAADFSQSGSRLKMHWLVAGDARVPQLAAEGFTTDIRYTESRFFDADLGVECSPKEWDDGAMYCTPGSTDGSWLLSDLSVDDDPVFRDPACTQPAIVVQQPQPPSPCVMQPRYAEIESGFGIIRGLATLGAPTTDSQYYQLHNYTGGPACEGPVPLPAGTQLYAATHVFNRSELVPITLGSPRGDTGRLKWQYIESPDGLVAPGVIYDKKIGRTCGLLDEGYGLTKTTCMYTRNPGDPVNDNRLAVVTLRPSSDARLSPTLVESDETRLPLGGLFYDRTVDLALRPVPTADGLLRAATRFAEPSPMYEDSACSIPIDLVGSGIDHVVTSSCSVIDHVYDVGAKAPQPYVYSQPNPPTPPSCVPYSGDAYSIGAEVPFDTLGPAVTVETD